MNIRLVIADVDGTLVKPNADKSEVATPRLIKAVEKVKEKGILFSIATARSLDKIEGLVQSLKLNSPIIVDNGARVYDCLIKQYIFSSYLSEKKVKEILTVLSEFPHEIFIDTTKNRISYDSKNLLTLKEVVKLVLLHITPYAAQEVFEVISKMKDIKVTKSVSGTDPVKESIHITNFDTGKDKALHRIADLSGINLEEVLTIGDSYNDFSLMTLSGFRVAMGNSVDEIKAIADYIAPTYQEDGVAHVLEKFILGKT